MEGNACISGSIGSLYSVYTVKYVKGMEPLMRASKFEAHTLTESQMHNCRRDSLLPTRKQGHAPSTDFWYLSYVSDRDFASLPSEASLSTSFSLQLHTHLDQLYFYISENAVHHFANSIDNFFQVRGYSHKMRC